MARSGGAEPSPDSGPQPQEADRPVPVQEVQLGYRECRRAMLVFQVTA